MELGKKQMLTVVKVVDFGVYLGDDREKVLLPKKQVPAGIEPGDPIVDDKSRYTDWSARDDIKANLQVDLILLLDEFGYPPVTIDDVYKEVLEQAENFKKYAN